MEASTAARRFINTSYVPCQDSLFDSKNSAHCTPVLFSLKGF
jgi:hypothetical protein